MKINRETLLNDLTLVKAGLSAREFIEQSSCFVFQAGVVMTFNDEVACRKKIGLKITGAVQASSLLDILGKLEEDELEVEEVEGALEFRGKRKLFSVVKDAEVFLPIDRVEMPDKWHPLDKSFIEGIGLVKHCVSTDQSRFLLTCVHIHPEFIESCDNHQMMRVSVKTGLKNPILVRGTSLEQLTTLAMTKVALTKSWIHFQNEEGLIYSCRRYVEDYPSLDKLLDSKGHRVSIPKGLVQASDRAAVFATDKVGDALVKVVLTEGTIEVAGEGLTGWYKERKKVVYKGPRLEFLISPTLLHHISERYEEATIGSEKMAVRGERWQYVTVLGAATDKDEAPETDEADES